MKKRVILVTAAFFAVFFITAIFQNKISTAPENSCFATESHSFELKPGDILVRPNWSWLPGSCPVAGGRKYGHVAIVTKGAIGNTISEALESATVAEALFFDQATKKFQFKKENQIRKGRAIVSFGRKFTGIRYRLRIPMDENLTAIMNNFIETQLDGGYNILSMKKKDRKITDNNDWHCATLIWQAYFLATGLDIDANGGLFIYPSDIIASQVFAKPGGIVRF